MNSVENSEFVTTLSILLVEDINNKEFIIPGSRAEEEMRKG